MQKNSPDLHLQLDTSTRKNWIALPDQVDKPADDLFIKFKGVFVFYMLWNVIVSMWLHSVHYLSSSALSWITFLCTFITTLCPKCRSCLKRFENIILLCRREEMSGSTIPDGAQKIDIYKNATVVTRPAVDMMHVHDSDMRAGPRLNDTKE